MKTAPLLIATILYGASTLVLYYNYTWSFYGDLLILLPLSLWGMERFFQKRRIGLFIFSVALTLFSNFYFSYYLKWLKLKTAPLLIATILYGASTLVLYYNYT
ncbi:YfhO family protein, partial [Streptococcus pneumoniae]|uniref:YfhO family protein n=1 Tax=Streptococcus pneumoniae TaxID=1313 RepID=UPI0039813921